MLPSLSIPGVLADRSVMVRLNGEAGRAFRIQASSNLKDWTEIGTVQSMHGEIEWKDAASSSQTNRYYRAVRVEE